MCIYCANASQGLCTMGKIAKYLGKMSTKDLKAHLEERGGLTVQTMTK